MNYYFLFVCFEVGGRKLMLLEFSFKKFLERNNEKIFRIFIVEKFLKEINKDFNGVNVQKLNILKILQF